MVRLELLAQLVDCSVDVRFTRARFTNDKALLRSHPESNGRRSRFVSDYASQFRNKPMARDGFRPVTLGNILSESATAICRHVIITSMGEAERGDERPSQVLLVDDDEALLDALRRTLTSPDVEVAIARSGNAALALLSLHRFDALVSDIQMPGMHGLKLLHAVREHDLDLPVVLITGNPDLKSAAQAVEYGAFQYLIKPISNGRLRAVVERAIGVGKLARLQREWARDAGGVAFFVGDRAGTEAKLDRALRSLWMAYQPIVSASDGTLLAYEALLRCEEPVLPHPGAVLKAAEKLRRVHDVGRAVRELVTIDAQSSALESLLLFVNLHPEDLLDPALYMPDKALASCASRVVLELTDRASLEDVSDVPGRMERLRALGFRIAIDDLCAGQADPHTFTQLEPEFVKLDLSVVRGIDDDPAKRNIVDSMVALCHKMGKLVIAEGVEKASQRDALREAGCDFLQGYFFGRPSPLPSAQRAGTRT